MSFLVVAAGHSGTKFLAKQLNRARGWTVRHEPDDLMIPELVNSRFEDSNYGEVNSWLLCSIRHIKCDNKLLLLRNPFDILYSIHRDSHFSGCPAAVVVYVREAMAILDGLIRDGYSYTKFRDITTSKERICVAAMQLGIDSLRESQLDLNKVNEHLGDKPELELPTTLIREFTMYNRRWGL
jgi:hypothetical protein